MNVVPLHKGEILTLDQIRDVARQFAGSNFFGENVGRDKQNKRWVPATQEQIFTKILIGRSLGLDIYESMSSVSVIKGKVVLAAVTMAAQVRRSKSYDYKILKQEVGECTIEFIRTADGKREVVGTSSFTTADAARAGLLRNDNYEKYPLDMMFARAMSRGVKHHCPDVFGCPVYVVGEIEEETPVKTTPEKAASDATPSNVTPIGSGRDTGTGDGRRVDASQTADGRPNDRKGDTAAKSSPTGQQTPGNARKQRPPRRSRLQYRGDDGDQPAKPEQITAIRELGAKRGLSEAEIQKSVAGHFGAKATLKSINRRQAASVILSLQKKAS
jgi:hypothetical protein